MEIHKHVNSFFNSISYQFGDWLIDPGDEWEVFKEVNEVLLTHAHFDHIYGLNELLRISPTAKVYTNLYGKEMLMDAKKNMSFYHETPYVLENEDSIVLVKDGEEIRLGNGQVAKAVFTPGHNPSCITWIIGDCLFSGDSYIPEIKTVTNLPGGNKDQAEESIELIMNLAKGRKIYLGHKIL